MNFKSFGKTIVSIISRLSFAVVRSRLHRDHATYPVLDEASPITRGQPVTRKLLPRLDAFPGISIICHDVFASNVACFASVAEGKLDCNSDKRDSNDEYESHKAK